MSAIGRFSIRSGMLSYEGADAYGVLRRDSLSRKGMQNNLNG